MRKLFLVVLCVGMLIFAVDGFAKKKGKTKKSHTQTYAKCYNVCNDIQKEAIQICIDSKDPGKSKCIQQAAKDKKDCMDRCRED